MCKWKNLYLDGGIIKRQKGAYSQLVMPRKFHQIIFHELHVEMGHLGRERFYWPRMIDDITHQVTKVREYLKQRKPQKLLRKPLTSRVTTIPFELISNDYMHLEKSSGGRKYILVVSDHIIKFAQAYPKYNKSGITAVKKIYNDFILGYGFPAQIHYSQGAEFENNLFKQLERLYGPGKHHIIKRGMAKLSATTGHC